jgi:hypothetical protein
MKKRQSGPASGWQPAIAVLSPDDGPHHSQHRISYNRATGPDKYAIAAAGFVCWKVGVMVCWLIFLLDRCRALVIAIKIKCKLL